MWGRGEGVLVSMGRMGGGGKGGREGGGEWRGRMGKNGRIKDGKSLINRREEGKSVGKKGREKMR